MKQAFFGITLAALAASLVLSAQSGRSALPSCDPDNGGLKLPAGFCALVVADNLGIARHMVAAPNGDLFVSLRDQRGRRAIIPGKEVDGAVVALRDSNGDGRLDVQEKFGDLGGTGVALRNGYVYHAQMAAVVRFPLKEGQLKPSGPAEVVAVLPEQTQTSHREKGLAFDGRGGMYVNVGGPSNTCEDPNDRTVGQKPCPQLEKHGGIWRFDENKTGQTQENGGRRYATGMRQFYALAWHAGALYTVQHGREWRADYPEYLTSKQKAELPSEELLRIEEGSNFGWPYCYHDQLQGKRVLSPEYGGNGYEVGDCAKYPAPVAAYPGHWAPGAVMFYTGSQLPRKYQGGAFITFQGSSNRARGRPGEQPEPEGGYNVVFQPFNGATVAGPYEVFADGFAGVSPLMEQADAQRRPGGLAQAPDGSIYISDLVRGRIWRVIYRGT